MSPTNAEIRKEGEQHVAAEMRRRGIQYRLAPTSRRNDFVIQSDRGKLTVQVRVTSKGERQGWLVHKELEHSDDHLVYAFVDTSESVPDTFIIPGPVVADVLRTSHQAWLKTPGRWGQRHKDSEMRMILGDYRFHVEGYPPGWLERYRERWDLLRVASL